MSGSQIAATPEADIGWAWQDLLRAMSLGHAYGVIG